MHKLVIALLCLPLAALASTVVIVSSTATCTLGPVVQEGVGCHLSNTVPFGNILEVRVLSQGIGAFGNRLGGFIDVSTESTFIGGSVSYAVTAENKGSFFAPVDLTVNYLLDFREGRSGSVTLAGGGTTVSLNGNCVGDIGHTCEILGSFFVAAGGSIFLDMQNFVGPLVGGGTGIDSYSSVQLTLLASDGVTPINLVPSPEPSTLLLILTALIAFSASCHATCPCTYLLVLEEPDQSQCRPPTQL